MGSCVVHTDSGQAIAVLNLLGRVFMDGFSCPFRAADQEIHRLKDFHAIVIIDFHAEAASQKQAPAWYLDGKAGAALKSIRMFKLRDERICLREPIYYRCGMRS